MKTQISRWISQVIFAISANLGALGIKTGFCFPFFYCHACPSASAACPIRAVEKSVYNYSFKWKLFFYPFVILGTVGVLTGRAVCGWACPIGLLQRSTAGSARFFKRKIPLFRRIGSWRYEKYLRYTKYILLICLGIITPFFITFMFTDLCPVGMLVGSFPILFLNPGKFVPNPFFWFAIVFFIAFIFLIFLIERGWCRYFCPVGAILAPFNKISFLSVEVDKDNCINCNACIPVCPMGIDIPNMNRDPECILCGKCIDTCPKNVIKFKRLK